MGPRKNLRVVFNTRKSQPSGSGKSGRNFQVQLIGCHRMCRTTPSVKKALRCLSTVKQSCDTSKRKRSAVPLDTVESGVIDSVRINEEVAASPSNGSKFSTTVETLTVSSGSEANKKKRKREILNSLGKSSIMTPLMETSSTNNGLHIILSQQTEGPNKDTSSTVTTQTSDPSILSKEKLNAREQKASLSSFRKRMSVTQSKRVRARPQTQKLRKLKSIGKNVSGKSVGKNMSRIVSGKKCAGNAGTPACSKKGSIKRKACACSEESLLQRMIQCYIMLKDSPSDSHKHISQLLGQEIEKAIEDGKSAPAFKKHYGQHCNNTSRNYDFTKLKADDHRNESLLEESNTESQVLEIEASFLVESSAAGGNQKIRSVSLCPPTVLSPNVNRERNDLTEKHSVGTALENSKESLPQVPPIQNLLPVVGDTQGKFLPSDPHHLQSQPLSSSSPLWHMKSDSSFSKGEERNLHSSVPNDISLKPQISELQQTQAESHIPLSESPISGQHHMLADPHPSLLCHTQSEPYSHDSYHLQTDSHSSVPHHTILEPYFGSSYHTLNETHSYSMHDMQKDLHSSDSHHTQIMSYSSVPHHTHTEGHLSVPHSSEAAPQPSVPQRFQQESYNSHIHTQPHSSQMPKEPPLSHMEREPDNPPTQTETHCSLLQTECHISQCKAEPHSLDRKTEATSSTPSKKRREITGKPNVSVCKYNLRSKDTRRNVSKSVSSSKAKNTNTLLKTHCKSDVRVCLTRVEHELQNMDIKITEDDCLAQQSSSNTYGSMSFPVSIARSMVQLPINNVVKLQKRLGDSEKMEDVDDKREESHVSGSSKTACIKNRHEWVAQKEGNKMSDDAQREPEIANHHVVAGVDYNQEGTVAKESSVEDYEAVSGATERMGEKSIEDFQRMDSIDDKTEKRCTGGCPLMIGSSKGIEETDFEDSQMLNFDKSIVETNPEGCQNMLSTGNNIEEMDTEGCQKMVDADNSVEETDTKDCHMMEGTDDSIQGANTKDCQAVVMAGDSYEETDTENCQVMVGADKNIEERDAAHGKIEEREAGDCQMIAAHGKSEERHAEDRQLMAGYDDSIREMDAQECQKMGRPNNNVKEIDKGKCHIVVGADGSVKEMGTKCYQSVASADDCGRGACSENMRETGVENYQVMGGADASIKRRVTEDYEMVVVAKNNVAGTYSQRSQKETICQMMVGGENTQKSTDVQDCHLSVCADKSLGIKCVESSHGEASGEISQEIIGAENTQGRIDVDKCHMLLVADNSLEGSCAENSQGYDDHTFSYLVSSLHSVSNSNYFGIHNMGLSLEETNMFLNYDPKEKSILCEQPVICERNMKEAHCSAVSGQCKATVLDHSSHFDSAAAEENLVAQYACEMSDEAHLFEDLESQFKGSGDWHMLESSNVSGAIGENDLVTKELEVERSAGCDGDPGKDAGSPPDTNLTFHHPVLDSHKSGSTSLENEEWRASSIIESAESDQEDVLSICTSHYSLLGSESSSEEDGLSESDDSRAFDEVSEGHTRECYPPNVRNEEVDADDNDEAPKQSSACNNSFDELEAGPGSDDPLSPTDSFVESLISQSSVIDRIIEDDARCSLSDDLEDGISTKSEANIGIEGEAHDDEKLAKPTPLPNHHQFLQSKSLLKECTETPSLQDSVASLKKISCQSKPVQNQVILSPKGKSAKKDSRDWNKLKEKHDGGPFKAHESTKDVCLLPPTKQVMAAPAPPKICESSNEEGMLLPVMQIMSPPAPPPPGIGESVRVEEILCPGRQTLPSTTTSPPLIRSKKIRVPRPVLSPNLRVCFTFMNRGFCNRSECIYTHKVTAECETYLGLLILHHVSEEREDHAWTLLDTHLANCGYPLPLAVSLLLPLAQYLVKHSHKRQCANIRVRSSFTLPLDIAKLRVLCDARQGKAAFNLLYAYHASASPEDLQILLNIFVRYCESCYSKQLLSPWEKVVMWQLESDLCDAEAKLKDLLNMEWLRIHMLHRNANKLWGVYRHLTQPMTSPSVFFTRITCLVIQFFNQKGQIRDSFYVLKEVRRLRANSVPIFTALIPKNKEAIPAVVEGLKELGQLVCELCVPMPANSWNLLLTYMIDIGDLYQTINLLSVQVSLMTPNVDILKRLLNECLKGSPSLLTPLCSLVCILPRNMLVPLQPSLSALLDAYDDNPSVCHIQSLIVQRCGKFGVNLNPQTQAALVPEVVNQAEACQVVSYIPPLECNSKKSPDGNRNSNEKSISNKSNMNSNSRNNDNGSSTSCSCSGGSSSRNNRNSVNTNSDSRRSSWILRDNLQTCTLLGSMNIQNEEGRHEVHDNGHVKSNGDYNESVKGIMPDGATPAMLEQSEMPLPPSPTSLPPSSSAEPVDDHRKSKKTKAKTTALIRPVHLNKQVTPAREPQHLQQSVVENSSYQQPSIEMSCNSDTKDKSFTNINLRNDTCDLTDLLLTPESTCPSVNQGYKEGNREQDSAVDSSAVKRKPFCSLQHQGPYITGQDGPSNSLSTNQEMCLESTNKSTCSLNKTAHNLLKASVEDIKLKGVKIPQFRVVKKINNGYPKTTSNQFLGSGAKKLNQRSQLNSLPPFDSTTYIDMEDDLGFGKLPMFPQVSEEVCDTSSSMTVPLQNKQLSNCLRTRNIRWQQSRSWRSHQDYEQSHSSAQFSHMSSVPSNTQQNQWFQVDKFEALSNPSQQSQTPASSPSLSSGFSDPYMHSSPASRQSSRISLRSSEYDHMDGGSNLEEASVSWLHEIAAMRSQEEKKRKLVEVAAAVTDGNNIFTSGTKITGILKIYGSGALRAEEKEVLGALALKVMVVCSQHKIFSEAELVVLALHQLRLSFFNSLAVWDGESYSEQQLAVMALRVLHHMGNHNLFISILEDTCWSGNADDVRARLELLSDVLEQQIDFGLNKIVMWCTGRVLASLVTYYHQDIHILHDYHSLIDLPSQLEAAWNWGEASGNVEVMEQFTVTLSTALRLGLPFSQHFLCRLRQRGVIVDNLDTLVATEDLCRPLQPQRTQRGHDCQWRVNLNRLPKGITRNKRNRGTFRGFSRKVKKRGNLRGQIAFRGNLVN